MSDLEQMIAVQQLLKNAREHITTCGQSLIGVSDDTCGGFTYTIGNHTVGLPELIAFGPPENMIELLNELGHCQRERGAAFKESELVSLTGKFPVKLVNATARAIDEYTHVTTAYYGDDGYRVTQVLICDKRGRYPDDPACEAPFSRQPVLRSS